MAARYEPRTGLGRVVHAFEENLIAAILGVMVLLTFVNVVLRYLFNALNVWSLEVVSTLFAWLVLLGIAYGFKVTMHLGVDAILNVVSKGTRRFLGFLAVGACLVYALLLLKGAWDYWAPFASLDRSSGRWFPTGFVATRTQAYIETGQIPMPDWLRWLEPLINDGDAYDKLPQVVPYIVLPISAVLILWRVIEVGGRLYRGEQDALIVSHEAEDAVEDAARKLGD